MSEEVRANEVLARIMRGNQTFNVVLTAGIRGILLLAQHLHRMHKEKLLSGGEIESFEKFLKATGGRFDIINVPVTEGNASELDAFQNMLEERKIRYHILPDLNGNDRRMQFCIYQPDAQRFAGCFQEYIQSQLSGGEMVEGNLMNLTDGHASLVSVPGEEHMEQFREDFNRLRINYAVMPDLRVGDGQVQILVANNDLPKMRHWYQLYQEDMLRQGRQVGSFRSMTMDEYQATAEMKPEEYIATSPADMRERLKKYEGMEKGEFEQAIDKLENQVRTADTYAFEKYLKNPEYEMLSIDHESLVAQADPSALPPEEQENFICRIPGTFKENERTLVIPKDQVFLVPGTGKDRYLAFVRSDMPPAVYDKAGKRVSEFATGKSLMEHFDQVKEKLSVQELQKTAEIAARLTQNVPVPNPVLAK